MAKQLIQQPTSIFYNGITNYNYLLQNKRQDFSRVFPRSKRVTLTKGDN